MAILGASQLKLHYADMEVFSSVTLEVNERSKIGLVGANGTGKTSLIKILLGLQDYDGGEIFKKDNLRIGYVPQTSIISETGTLKTQIMSAFDEIIRIENEMSSSALEIELNHGQERLQSEKKYSGLLEQYESLGGYDYINLMERVVEGVGLSNSVLDNSVADASGGERTRAALATALLKEPELLILDEPTNYLDFKGLEWLEGFLNKSKNSYVVVSHDRFFLDSVVEEIWEIDKKKLKTYKGNYSKYKIIKEEEIQEIKEYAKQQEHIKKEEDFIARYHAGQRSKEARGRTKKLNRIDRLSAPQQRENVIINNSKATRTGQVVLSTKSLSVGHISQDSATKLFDLPDIQIQKETTTAIIGNNGIGKTTLLKTLLNETSPIKGSVEFGHNVQTGYFKQGSDEIPTDLTVIGALLEIKNIPIGEARSFLAKFLFKGDDIMDKVSSLSGGEKGRLALARLLLKEPNVLILDEPTTHLDIPSREALEIMLQNFEGTIIFVSHDRHLISLLADNLLIIENRTVIPFKGPYQEWVDNNMKQNDISISKKRKAKFSKSYQNTKTGTSIINKNNVGLENEIKTLESQISEIEKKLEKASDTGDMDTIYELGDKHSKLSAILEKNLSKWITHE